MWTLPERDRADLETRDVGVVVDDLIRQVLAVLPLQPVRAGEQVASDEALGQHLHFGVQTLFA